MTQLNGLTAIALLVVSMFLTSPELFAQGESTDKALIRQRKLPQIGRLGLPLKTPAVLEGFVVEGPSKGSEGGPNLVIQRIDGKATQKFVRIRLQADPEQSIAKFERRSVFQIGYSYRLDGLEDGSIVGGTQSVKGLPVQTYGGPTYIPTFVVQRIQRIEPIRLHPQEFVDRKGLFEGTALHIGGKPYLVGNGWLFAFPKVASWPEESVGKRIEVLGVIRPLPESGSFESNGATPQLVSLKDQIGRTVSLRGTTKSKNGEWSFEYRGQVVHVENMDRLSAEEYHHMPTQVDGILEVAMLPTLEDTGDQKPALRYVVRQASWKRIESLLTPELSDLSETRSNRN